MSKTALKPVRKEGNARKHSYANSYSNKHYGYHGYYREKRPRELNKALLIATVLFLAIGGTSLYFWHDYQIRRLSDTLLAYGDEMAAQEKWREASDAYFRVWKILQTPEVLGKFTPAYDKTAVSYNRAGVIGSYQRATGELPERIDLRNRLSELLLADGQYQQALAQAEKALAQKPDNQAAHKWRALALLELRRSGNPVESINVLKELNQAFSLQSDDVGFALQLANYMRADLMSPCTKYSVSPRPK